MSISEIIVKVIGVILAVFGLITILNSVTGLPSTWVVVVVGLALLGIGLWIIRGGNISL